MKKTIATILMLVCLCLTAVGCVPKRTIEKIEKEWGIDLPDNMVIEYDINDVGFDGGSFYTVFKLDADPTDFIADFSNETDKVNLISLDEKIPEDLHPNWNADYLWKFIGKDESDDTSGTSEFSGYDDKLFMVYFPETMRLFIYEVLY
jgi:hypothetical protein